MSVSRAGASRQPSAALEIAAEVIAWARSSATSRPEGRVGEKELGLGALASPPRSLVEAAGALAAKHAARLGLRAPPLGDARPFGYGGLVLATAVGLAFAPAIADAVALVCPVASSAWDLVLRDAIVSRVVVCPLDADLLDTLRARSPLSAVLDRPAPGGEDEALATIERVAAHPDGRRVIVHVFSRPGASAPVRRFRASSLERLRMLGEFGLGLVLDVYEAALVHHEARVRVEVGRARRALARAEGARGVVEDALSVAAFYGPLSRIRRAAPSALRQRPYLDLEGILEVTRLHRMASSLLGESA